MIVIAEISPVDQVAGVRKLLRLTTHDSVAGTGVNSQDWSPAIVDPPIVGIRLFKGDFDGKAAATGGSLKIALDQVEKDDPSVRSYFWPGAPIKLWAGVAGQAWPWQQVFDGGVVSSTAEGNILSIQTKVNDEPFEVDALISKYAGTGGIEGGEDLKETPKPLLFGRCFNVAPVLIDAVNNVYQVHGYGPIEAVTKLYERGSDFDADIVAFAGDFANYAALVAATIAPGRWGTCLAQGLIRLGAPQAGVITADVDGDKGGAIWRNKAGAVILRLCEIAGVSGTLIESASFTAIDTALLALPFDGMMGWYQTQQTSVLSLASQLTSDVNHVCGVSLLGKLFASPLTIGTPTITLDAQGRQDPTVYGSKEESVSPPFSLIEMGYARSWRVHTEDELALVASTPASVTYYQDDAPTAGASIPNDRWIDTNDNLHEYLRGPDMLTIGGVTYTFGGQSVTIPWFEVGDHTADNTAANVPLLDYSPPRVVNCDDSGAPFTGQFPDRSSIRVFRNGASIKASDSTDFFIRTANNLTNAVVDNVDGSLTKGDWTVDGMTANSGLLEIEVRVDSNLIGIASIPFSKSYPVQVVTGGAGVKSASVGPNATVSGTTDAVITPVVKLAVASGEAINVGASLDYTIDGSNAEQRAATFTLQYSSDGSTGWTALASSVVGSWAIAGGSVFNSQISEYDWVEPQSGHADISQNKTGLAAQDWFVRVVAKLNATGRTAAFSGPINWSVS